MNDPQTPEDYLEILSHVLEIFKDQWDKLPDGDGEHGSPDNVNRTKTDMFTLIAGCASTGRDSIKKQNKIKQMVDSL